MHTKISLIALLFLLVSAITAQSSTGSISGKVTDANGKPLACTNVILLKASDSTIIKAELTNEQGEYHLTPVSDGNYLLKAILLGYDDQQFIKVTISGKDIFQPDMILLKSNNELKNVAITAQKQLIEVHPDKLVLNVENSSLNTGSSALEVLGRSPGVTLDQNDHISLKGKQGVNVMIDGRTQPISSDELANMLKSMPSSSIEKIEIISNPSAKYDAAGTAGIINIITKRDKKMGFNGTVTAGYGQGVYPKQNAGINLNYRNNKLNIYLNYNESYRTGFHHVSFNREFYEAGVFNTEYVQDNYGVLQFKTHNAACGFDYSLSPKTSVGAAVNGESFFLGTNGHFYSNVLGPNYLPQSSFITQNTSGGKWDNIAPNVHLKHTFDTSGKELTIDADYANFWNNNLQDFATNYYLPSGAQLSPPYILHAAINGLTQIRSIKADYVNPLPKNAKFEAGIKSSYVTADNQPRFYNRSQGSDVYDSTKSDHYLYNETINAAYVNVSKNWAKYSTQLGLRAEQTFIHGHELVTGQELNNNYVQLFPSLALQDHLDGKNDMGITLSRRIERPGYEDLNPYKFFVDPSTYRTGNPYLKPALTYAVELSHVYDQRLVTTLSYSVTDHVMTEEIMPATNGDKLTIQTKQNLTRMQYIGFTGSYSFNIRKWWSNVTNFDAYYSKYQGNLANTNLNSGKPTYDINTVNRFTVVKDFFAELSIIYQAPQVVGFLYLEQLSMFNIGFQKNLPKQRLTLKINANDIFWHGKEIGYSNYTNYSENFISRHDSRQVNLSISYRFGNKSINAVSRHSGGAEDEKKRAGGGNG